MYGGHCDKSTKLCNMTEECKQYPSLLISTEAEKGNFARFRNQHSATFTNAGCGMRDADLHAPTTVTVHYCTVIVS